MSANIQRRSLRSVIASQSCETLNDPFDRGAYPPRNVVERLIGWLKEPRCIATRYDKLVTSCLAFIQLAAMRSAIRWL
nr:transposase [Novipirellula galeiformis]